MKIGHKTWFFSRDSDLWNSFVSPAVCAPGDHGDHGTSVSDEIDQEMEVGQNTWF